LKILYSTVLLPEDRTLLTFKQISDKHKNMNDKQYIGAYYEDSIKRLYSEFIETLKRGVDDDLDFFRKLCVGFLADMLNAR
jgi:hypothetical protein